MNESIQEHGEILRTIENNSCNDQMKLEPINPNESSAASSTHNSEDDDSDQRSNLSYKERRREAHTHAEQKRRDAIKRGYYHLQQIVPMCQLPENSGQKISKVTVLQRSVDYMQFLVQQKKKQEDEVNALRKEVIALEIMKINYEKIVSAQQNSFTSNNSEVSDKLKFEVFQTIMDSLFNSFNASISVASFAELSGCVLNWIEEYCKPQSLRELTLSVLRYFNPQLT